MNTNDFNKRFQRWKNGERYWDIRGIDLPRYDTADKITVTADDGSVFNVAPSAIGARNLEVTTPDVEVVAQKPLYLKKRDELLNGTIYNPGEIRQSEGPSTLDNVRKFLANYRNNPIARNLEQSVEDWQHRKTPMQASFDNFAYLNPYTAALAAGSNLLSDHGVNRTITLAKNGQYSGATLSGLGDMFDLAITKHGTNQIGKYLQKPFNNIAQRGIDILKEASKYRLTIPQQNDSYYRVVNGMEAIDDANSSGMITRPYYGGYMFPYFKKGELYSDKNGAYNYGNRIVVIQSKPNQQFEFVNEGTHTTYPGKQIYVGDAATPVVKNRIGTAYNSAPAENFVYWTKGRGPISKYFWKKNEFTPFKDEKIITADDYGAPIAEGSESAVFADPHNDRVVLKEYSGGYRNNLFGMRDELIRRNSIPGAVPTKIQGITQDGYPVLSQPKIKSFPEGTRWKYSMVKDLLPLFRNSGYVNGLHDGVPNNGIWRLLDVSPQNIGYIGNKIRLIDVVPVKLNNK